MLVVGLIVAAVMSRSIFLHNNQKDDLSWIIDQQNDNGWYVFKWGMYKEQVRPLLVGEPAEQASNNSRSLDRFAEVESISGVIRKAGMSKDCFDVDFKFNNKTKMLERLEVNATPPLLPGAPTPSYYKEIFTSLHQLMINKYGKPTFSEEILKGNIRGILHGNSWEVKNKCFVDLIETPNKTTVIYTAPNGEHAFSFLFLLTLDEIADDLGKSKVQNNPRARTQLPPPTRETIETYKIIRNMAVQGDDEAQFKLGWGYVMEFIPFDPQDGADVYTAATKWFRKAAEQGNADAQRTLGHCYKNGGEGVPQSYADAAKWFRKAAEQGDAPAQSCIGALYQAGKGVQQDYVEAYKWYSLAAAAEKPGAFASWTQSRDELKALMTVEQIAEGQSRVDKFVATKQSKKIF
jgi:hypothetical protein